MGLQICFFLRFIFIGFWNCSDSVVFCVFHFIIKGHEVYIVLPFESDSHEVWTSFLCDCNFTMYILKRRLTEIHAYTKLVVITINGTYPLLILIQMLILLLFFFVYYQICSMVEF